MRFRECFGVRMSRFFRRSVFVLSLALLVALIAGEFGLRAVIAGSDQDGAYKQLDIYSKVLSRIQSEYVTEPNLKDVTTGALHGLLETLDADSSYLTADEYKIYKDRPMGGDAQVGIVVSKRYGYATVVTVVPGSPADKEHFSDGDVIESIGGQSTREIPLAVIKLMLEGKAGSTVTLSVIRPRKADPDKVTLTRTVTAAPALAEQQLEDGNVLYLKPGVLTAARVDEVAARVKALGKGKKIVLDLRDVTDGDASEGLRLANLFVKQGTLATLSGQKVETKTFAADAAKWVTDAPVAVLVNRGTAGAAEIAAGALGDSKRASVVGERTFGQGSVQKTIELPDGAALLLTEAEYVTPAGKKIMMDAVTPTVVVGPAADAEVEDEEPAVPAKTDAILTKALEVLKTA